MLVNLTPIQEEIDRRSAIAKEHDFEYIPQSDPKWLQETGIYQSSCSFNFPNEEFVETKDLTYGEKYDIFPNYEKITYGVADTIEQIKEYYKEEIEDKDNKYCIELTPVWQELENKGKGGGWRWHKWGKYIGKLDPQHEHLDDEEFGDEFKYIIIFTIIKVMNSIHISIL